MKKLGKIVVGITAATALIGGCVILVNKLVKNKAEDDFMDDEDDFVELEKSTNEKDYINISNLEKKEEPTTTSEEVLEEVMEPDTTSDMED